MESKIDQLEIKVRPWKVDESSVMQILGVYLEGWEGPEWRDVIDKIIGKVR